uniref:Snurportin-1 n=1 Tax=Heterosigma akashiwo TaxID=2829 RepID=A0A7S3Y4S7_HETAK
MQTKMADEGVFDPNLQGDSMFMLVPHYQCSLEGLREAYSGQPVAYFGSESVPFIRDGLVFYHKESHYHFGPTPLTLIWKDSLSSRYLVFNSSQRVALQVIEQQQVDGRQPSDVNSMEESDSSSFHKQTTNGSDSGSLFAATLEGFVLVTLDADTINQHKIKCGDIVRFEIGGALETDQGPALAAPRFAGRAAQGGRGGGADGWSKVLFQAAARAGAGAAYAALEESVASRTVEVATHNNDAQHEPSR